MSSITNSFLEILLLVRASGTHSVCVCSIHQDVKLLFDALPNNTYKTLLKLIVCGKQLIGGH